jgi:hypothetical protein
MLSNLAVTQAAAAAARLEQLANNGTDDSRKEVLVAFEREVDGLLSELEERMDVGSGAQPAQWPAPRLAGLGNARARWSKCLSRSPQTSGASLRIHRSAHIKTIEERHRHGIGIRRGRVPHQAFNAEGSRARLRTGERILRLEDTLVEAREKMRYKATHDVLTSIWNRGVILDLLSRELSRSHRESTSTVVLLGDVDHFKSVNDTYGHLVGDDVLQEIAKRLVQCIRNYDFVGRYDWRGVLFDPQ